MIYPPLLARLNGVPHSHSSLGFEICDVGEQYLLCFQNHTKSTRSAEGNRTSSEEEPLHIPRRCSGQQWRPKTSEQMWDQCPAWHDGLPHTLLATFSRLIFAAMAALEMLTRQQAH